MFHLAQSSLKNNSNLKRVILVKSLPRYDSNYVDPNSIKSKLNQFGNTLYNTLWMQSGCPSNILIVDQHLDCQGPLREKRFGNPAFIGHDGKPWDGIHMRGRLAMRHYTNSFIRILSELSPSLYHRSCPQTKYQSRHTANYVQADNYQYQRGSHSNRSRYNYRHGQTQQQTGYNSNRQYNTQHYGGYNVGVSNRFENLGNF